MVTISKEEKELIREKFPNVLIVRTMKHKSKRHRYYCEEVPRVMKFLNKIRQDSVQEYVCKNGRVKHEQ